MDIDLLLALRPHVRLVSHLPGRVRLRAAPTLSVLPEAGRLDELSGAEGLRAVRVNRLTGSVLIEYDEARLSPDLVQALFASPDPGEARRAALLLWPA
ncbi:hypothetical protein dsat_0647 [Alkalidesulfovibrio alkalitolerans DSM 16529]|uniref:Uncharacterized protein n=1 Tax=Alkalidesulfovibrio alkalitolerans DSM 16529 TaxID=1121439 RepID=S7T754_9BACT|nr:hypothetical protein [Alkalidesulfovibrio alkalitolerans]EPR32295.1 hypothetical protein dsat_0647 [Alkalidesulfovibrio alkalitolerans DSM 16529]